MAGGSSSSSADSFRPAETRSADDRGEECRFSIPARNLFSSRRHHFWESQPVVQLSNAGNPSFPDGPIAQPTHPSLIRKDPYRVHSNYEWAVVDIDDDVSLADLHRFIVANFTNNAATSYTISTEFLRWILRAPGYIKSLHVGVCVKETKKLVGFISGAPISLRIKAEVVRTSVSNLLVVHKKLRNKGIAQVLIKELARRAQLEGIWQGVFSTFNRVPTPFCGARWLTRIINPKKLVDLGFLRLDAGNTIKRLNKTYKVPEAIDTVGFRLMGPRDIGAVTKLLRGYLRDGFWVAPEVDEHFVEHFLLPTEGLVDSYLVEDMQTNEITDFCSFYIHTIPTENNLKYSEIKCGFLFYYAASRTPLVKLMGNLLVMAKREGCDLMKALAIMGNETFLDKLNFRFLDQESLHLYYYLYNYRLRMLLKPGGLALIIL